MGLTGKILKTKEETIRSAEFPGLRRRLIRAWAEEKEKNNLRKKIRVFVSIPFSGVVAGRNEAT
jgi:hypothetical protein